MNNDMLNVIAALLQSPQMQAYAQEAGAYNQAIEHLRHKVYAITGTAYTHEHMSAIAQRETTHSALNWCDMIDHLEYRLVRGDTAWLTPS